MSLTADMLLPGGEYARVDSDVLEIDRRVREGDELWRGDPSMSIIYNFVLQRFEVWGIDATGAPYCAASGERCDHDLLRKLAEGDWQRGKDVEMSVILHERARKDRIAADQAEARGEAWDKLAWSIRQDLGHLEGGRKNVWGWTPEGADR